MLKVFVLSLLLLLAPPKGPVATRPSGGATTQSTKPISAKPYKEPVQYIYAHASDWHSTYAMNLLAGTHHVGNVYMIPSSLTMIARGKETDETGPKACVEARIMGYQAMPGIASGLSSYWGHSDYRAWLDRETWARYARATISAASGCDHTKRMVVDLEPYWEGQRYLPNTEENRDLLKEAMQPWIETLQKLEIKLYVLPGYHSSYAFCPVLAEAGVVEAWCGETTYNDPRTDATVSKIKALDAEAKAATGIPLLSGHYARWIMTPTNWFDQIGDHWIYISGWPEDDKWNFGKDSWFK